MAVGGHAGGDDFESGNVGGIAVPFPAHEAWDAVTLFHAGAVEEPVVGIGADPIRPAGHVAGRAGADQGVFVGTDVWETKNRVEPFLAVLGSVAVDSGEDAAGPAVGGGP